MILRLILCLFLFVPSASLASDRLLVFAAASQQDALVQIGRLFESKCECRVAFSFAASSTLARQIDAGAEANVYIAANRDWVDWLEAREKLNPDIAAVFAGNRLVVASAAKTKDSFNILLRGRFAMADPKSVPAGIYAREALSNMGIWEQAKKQAVYAENVRVALAMVARQDLLSGIVYASDLKGVEQLHAHFIFPEGSHKPIRYFAVATQNPGSNAEAFISFLNGVEAQGILEQFGFLTTSETMSQ